MGLANLQLLKMQFSETTFATENPSPVLQFDVRAGNIELTREQQMHKRQHRVQRITMHGGNVLGRKSGRLSFAVDMVGDGVALTSGATATDDSLQNLLKRCLGNSQSAAGSWVVSGGTSKTIIPIFTSHGTLRFKAGGICMIASTGTSNVNEIRPIASVGASSIKLAIETTNTANSGSKVYNAYCAYVDPSATSTMQAQVVGDDNEDVYLALGCAGGFAFEKLLQTDDVCRVVPDLFVTKWEADDYTLAAGSYDGANPLWTNEEMEVHYQTVGTATANKVNVAALDIAPNVTWTPFIARGSSDKEHVSEIVMTACKPTASFTADNDEDFLTVHNAQTEKHLFVSFGRTPGQSWAVWLPRNVLAPGVPARAASAEQTVMNVQLEALENDDAATALGRSPIVVARV